MPRQKRRQSRKIEAKPCTYDLGYVRQDLYACRLCYKRADKAMTAFCRSCRDVCHADHLHQVFELYTKRNFRCDCGNKRAGNKCLMNPEKDDFNVGNDPSYSHNFEGRYCRCDKEYDITLAMAQCAMCEDWFHEKCYKLDKQATDRQPYCFEYEFTCKDCVQRLPLLAEYYDVLSVWRKQPEADSPSADVCIRPREEKPSTKPGSVDYMWQPDFRLSLCQCAECMREYERAKVLYLVDRNDLLSGGGGTEYAQFLAPVSPAKDEQMIEELLQESQHGTPRKVKQENSPDKLAQRPPAAAKRIKQSDPHSARKRRILALRAPHVEDDETVGKRIRHFVEEAVRTNGASMTRVSLLQYKKDMDNCPPMESV